MSFTENILHKDVILSYLHVLMYPFESKSPVLVEFPEQDSCCEQGVTGDGGIFRGRGPVWEVRPLVLRDPSVDPGVAASTLPLRTLFSRLGGAEGCQSPGQPPPAALPSDRGWGPGRPQSTS